MESKHRLSPEARSIINSQMSRRALIAGAGFAGAALGFGAQSLVKDVISGIFIVFEDQYGVGDSVDEPRVVARADAHALFEGGAGRALLARPKLLLVDEPVAGMTDVETETTAQVLREINKTHSIVVVEHDMSFVRALGVKVTVLHEGSMLAEGTLDQVSADQRVVEVYLGR